MTEIITNAFFNTEKLKQLNHANELLHLNNRNNNKLVFVYSAPKVGSTSIVSSLRIFGSDKLSIIHIHDEAMLKVLTHIDNVTINEIILYNKFLGKDVYVINVYRSPIERKISAFFEKVGSYHFNNEDKKVNTYNVNKVINRFDNIFPHIGLGDHFLDRYLITHPTQFDYTNKYLLVVNNNIKYIALRLKDSNLWGNILTNIFGFKICIVKDYESTNKPIKDLYNIFKTQYKIPKNLLDDIMKCKYLNYYYSEEERNGYYNEWLRKSSQAKISYTVDQYALYEEITIANSYFDCVQLDHYMDEGCICKACNIKRSEISSKIMRGIPVTDKIIHSEARTELIEKRVIRANQINQAIYNSPIKGQGKDFKREMINVVNNKKTY